MIPGSLLFTMVASGKNLPTFGAFTIPNELHSSSFTITPPTTNSPGAWTFSSNTPSVVSITNASTGAATAGVTGTVNITASQAATGNYLQRAVTASCTITSVTYSGVWSSSTVMPTAMGRGAYASTSKNDVIATSGWTGTGVASLTTEYWNGSSWGTRNPIPAAGADGCGIGSTSSMFAYVPPYTAYGYSGSSWLMLTNTLSHSHGGSAVGFGTSTSSAGLVTGTTSANSGYFDIYNGSAWSAGVTFPYGWYNSASGVGTLSAGIIVGGSINSVNQNTTFNFNGSSWSTGATLNNIRRYGSAFGTTVDTVYCGGYIAAITPTTEVFNGTSWATTGNLPANTYEIHGSAGTVGAGIAMGGFVSSAQSNCATFA